MIKKYQNIETARKLYLGGENVTSHFQNTEGEMKNSPEVIEIAYELQAGSYIKFVKENPEYSRKYTDEMAEILNRYIQNNDKVLDIGTGELTTLSQLVPKIKSNLSKILAFDISWSRLKKGLEYASVEMGDSYNKLEVFVADMFEIPLASRSVEVVISSHALEPNGGREKEILKEIFRVSSEYCILFEPCYEINSVEGQKRMDKMGYVKNLEKHISDLGGVLIEKIAMNTVANPLNPTAGYIIKLNKNVTPTSKNKFSYSIPGTDIELKKIKNVMFSPYLGVSFPFIDSIPVLKNEFSIITTAMSEVEE